MAFERLYGYVRGQATAHGCTVYDCSEQTGLHSDGLWAVACNRLLEQNSLFPKVRECSWAYTAKEQRESNMAVNIVFIHSPNVTVQGTRHFVEGTLEPLVQRFHFRLLDGFPFV